MANALNLTQQSFCTKLEDFFPKHLQHEPCPNLGFSCKKKKNPLKHNFWDFLQSLKLPQRMLQQLGRGQKNPNKQKKKMHKLLQCISQTIFLEDLLLMVQKHKNTYEICFLIYCVLRWVMSVLKPFFSFWAHWTKTVLTQRLIRFS